MRSKTYLDSGWMFTKTDIPTPLTCLPTDWERVSVPHTWNNLDGQDGGNDYFRGGCWYAKALNVTKQNGRCYWLEFEGVNSVADVYVNSTHVAHHEGGYSTFRADITDVITGNDIVWVRADNSENPEVYPQMADFTFYGGIYRDAALVEVAESHFELGHYGDYGFKVIPKLMGDRAEITLSASITNPTEAQTVVFNIMSGEENIAQCVVPANAANATVTINNPHLWNGRFDPFLYKAEAVLLDGNTEIDNVSANFGIRTYHVDPEKGFILNGKPYPLRGVSRHQDREAVGNALTHEHQDQDIKLIAEVGANTIRLAHYQHSQYFYDLCDKYGMVIWAEIPFISMYEPKATPNTLEQMRELIYQNINHASVCFWGISNEISIGGESDELIDNLNQLEKLCKELDPSRMTTIAHVSMVPTDSPMQRITDVVSYNHYFGWYGGDVSQNGPWFDEYHRLNPDIPLGVSEYGAEGILTWHSATPECRDYTEEYQAHYHHEMLKTFATRPYLWSTHVWNMFDFGSDMRDEGGVKGRNNKGLVNFDRTIKKDSFYIYKAFWSNEPFVHVCGRRFVNRVVGTTTITVYSNCERVELNGVSVEGADKAFVFENMPLELGENIFKARGFSGDVVCEDTIVINGVETADESYILKEEVAESAGGGVANWFDGKTAARELEIREGFLSVKDSMGEIMTHPQAAESIAALMSGAGMKGGGAMLKMVEKMPLEAIIMFTGKKIPADAIYVINDILNKIPKN